MNCQDRLNELRDLVGTLQTLLGTVVALGKDLAEGCGSFCLSFEDPGAGGDECDDCQVPFEPTDTGFV